jgi:hypothetical protein
MVVPRSYKDNQVSFVQESEEKSQRQLVDLSVESQPVKRRLGGWREMAISLGVSCNRGSCKGAAVQSGLEPGSRGIAIVISRYRATTSEDITGWKSLSMIL